MIGSVRANLVRGYAWTWADATARQAQVVTVADLGAVGYQVDMARDHRLVEVSGGVGTWSPQPDGRFGPIAYCMGVPTQTTTTNIGLFLSNGTGTTLAARSIALTNRSTQRARMAVNTAGTAAASAALKFGIGGGNYVCSGGFRQYMVAVPGAVSATMRWWLGFANNAYNADADPSTFLSCVGIGNRGSDANVRLMYNDGSGACTVEDLGASFPHGLNDGYELEIYCDGVTTAYGVQIRRLNTGLEYSKVVNTNVPPLTATAGLFGCYGSNNADAAVVSLDFSYYGIQQLR